MKSLVHSPEDRLIPAAQEDAMTSLVEALVGFDDDYMTSEVHHPDYVLIPVTKFEAIREALAQAQKVKL